MKDQNKTKKQLVSELVELRQRITELEALENKFSQAKEALRQSEARYRTLFEDSRDAVYITTLGGKVIDVNKAFLDLLGYTKGELAGITSQDTYVNSYDRQRFQKEIEQKGFVRDFEAKLRKKDNTVIDCMITSSLWLDNGGNILGYQGIVRDVTERKQILNELRTEKQKFQTLSENAPFAMVMIGQDGTFRYINPKFRELFGYDLTDVPNGRTWFRKAYPDSPYRHDVISAWKEDLKNFKPGEKRPRVFTVTCKDGVEKIINFIPVQLETNENLMACEDITERKQAETALRKSEEKHRTILHSIEEFYYEVDLAGNMTFFNDPMVKISGYSKEELMGMNYRKYVSEETAKKVYQTFNEVYRTGIPTKGFDWEVIRKDGTRRFLETSVSLRHDPKGQPAGFFGIGRDITERKQAEERERDLQRAKDKVLNHLSHELRTPVSVIQGSIRILKRKIQKQTPTIVGGEIFDILEKNLGHLSHIQQKSDKIIRTYGELKKISHIEAHAIPSSAGVRRISLYSFVQEVLGKVKEEFSHRNIQIILEGAEDLSLDANPGVLKGMFIGLLKNAIENTPDEGRIQIVLEQKAQWLQLKFMDFGIGITKENQRRLFDGLFHTPDTELYRSKKPYDFGSGGRGLDLLWMKVYSQRFGLDISVASQRCLYLPTDRDLCPGKISQCPHCRVQEDCFNSGGSTFSLTFAVGGGIEVKKTYSG